MPSTSPGALGTAAANPLQTAQGLVGGGVLQQLKQPPKLGKTRQYGLGMRFTVQLIGTAAERQLIDLGEWQSCDGLKVNFNLERVASGGDNWSEYSLPGPAKYDAITVTRAVEAERSLKVWTWLNKYLTACRDGVGTPSYTAVVSLFGNDLRDTTRPVMRWELHDVVPSAWTGPALSATDNRIAVEKLELFHRGFLGAAPPVSAMSLSDGTGVPVRFPYNPSSMTIAHNSRPSRKLSINNSKDADVESEGTTVLGLSDLILVGTDVPDTVRRLIGWATEQDDPRATRAGKGDATAKKLTPLTFTWDGMRQLVSSQVVMTSLKVQLVRFDPTGRPVRAKVVLGLEEYHPPVKAATGSGRSRPTPSAGRRGAGAPAASGPPRPPSSTNGGRSRVTPGGNVRTGG